MSAVGLSLVGDFTPTNQTRGADLPSWHWTVVDGFQKSPFVYPILSPPMVPIHSKSMGLGTHVPMQKVGAFFFLLTCYEGGP